MRKIIGYLLGGIALVFAFAISTVVQKAFDEYREGDDQERYMSEQKAETLSRLNNSSGSQCDWLEDVPDIMNEEVPRKVSNNVTWVDVSRSKCVLENTYVINSIPESFDVESTKLAVKRKMEETVCKSDVTKKIINKGADVEYTYENAEDEEIFSVSMSKSDCEREQ